MERNIFWFFIKCHIDKKMFLQQDPTHILKSKNVENDRWLC